MKITLIRLPYLIVCLTEQQMERKSHFRWSLCGVVALYRCIFYKQYFKCALFSCLFWQFFQVRLFKHSFLRWTVRVSKTCVGLLFREISTGWVTFFLLFLQRKYPNWLFSNSVVYQFFLDFTGIILICIFIMLKCSLFPSSMYTTERTGATLLIFCEVFYGKRTQ